MSVKRVVRLGALVLILAVTGLLLSSYLATTQVATAGVSCSSVTAAADASQPDARGICTRHQPCLIGYNCCGDPAAPPGHCGQNGTGNCCGDGSCCKAGFGCDEPPELERK